MDIKILKWDRLKGTEKLTSGDNIKMYLKVLVCALVTSDSGTVASS